MGCALTGSYWRVGGARCEPRMEQAAGSGQQLAASGQIDAIVGLARIGRAGSRAHELRGPQPTEMVRDQVLGLADEFAELADLAIAPRQL